MNFSERERPEVSVIHKRIHEAIKLNDRFGISEGLGFDNATDVMTTNLYIAQKINRNAITIMERLLFTSSAESLYYTLTVNIKDVPDKLRIEKQAQGELEKMQLKQKLLYSSNKYRWVQIGEAVRDIMSQAEKKNIV